MFSVSIIYFWSIVVRSQFTGDVRDFAFGLPRSCGQENWNVVVGRQAVGLAGDAAAALGVRRRDRCEEREVVGLGQPPAAASDSAERHLVVSRLS